MIFVGTARQGVLTQPFCWRMGPNTHAARRLRAIATMPGSILYNSLDLMGTLGGSRVGPYVLSVTETRLLPADLPLFPLAGVVLLPGETLQLNVFEPRYLNMVDDALRSERCLGIIQTRPGGSFDRPGLAPVGCAGEITSFEETSDGRYLISLHGLARFELGAELDKASPYRVAQANYAGFHHDLRDFHEPHVDRGAFLHLLVTWLQTEGLSIDRSSLEAAPLSTLVNQLAMKGPFSSGERQILLTAKTIESRLELIEDIMAARLAASASGPLH